MKRHLSNIYDHRLPDAQVIYSYDLDEIKGGPKAMRAAWQRHLDWIHQHEIGPPQATELYSVEQLESWNMIGLYSMRQIDTND